MEILVGYSGFVGSNICAKHNFDGLYDSTNVKESYGTNPDLLVYSGVPAQKFLANKEPEKDFEIIKGAIDNIKAINPKEIVLISTIDIYKNPNGANEDTFVDTENLQPYGYNRYYLEQWVKKNIEKHLIIHLPGLYGKNIKKNFIYDFIKFIPALLTNEKYEELLKKDDYIKKYYISQDNGFYKCKDLSSKEEKDLKEYFKKVGFSALNFTDSRGIYQFYPLKLLWEHITIARKNNLQILNLATEPISIAEIYKYVTGETFLNEVSENIPFYDFRTKNDKIFGGKNGYIFDKEFILKDIKKFITENAK